MCSMAPSFSCLLNPRPSATAGVRSGPRQQLIQAAVGASLTWSVEVLGGEGIRSEQVDAHVGTPHHHHEWHGVAGESQHPPSTHASDPSHCADA